MNFISCHFLLSSIILLSKILNDKKNESKKMKSQFIILGMALLANITVYSQNTVTLQAEPDTNGKNKHGSIIPIINYNTFSVSVNSTIFIGDVRVIITDITGREIYNKVVDVLPTSNVLDIPEEYVSEKFKIELRYDKKKIYGYFQQE